MEVPFLVKLVYSCLMAAISILIAIRTRRFYLLSGHKGIQSFSSAFLFFSLSFFMKGLGIVLEIYGTNYLYFLALSFLSDYFLILSILYLIFSIGWSEHELGVSQRKLGIHIFATIVALMELFLSQGYVSYIFITMSVIITIGIIKAYDSYTARKGFMQLYMIALVLMLFGFIINYMARILDQPYIMLYSQAASLMILIIFLYGVIYHGKKKRTS